MQLRLLVALLTVVLLALSACGGSDDLAEVDEDFVRYSASDVARHFKGLTGVDLEYDDLRGRSPQGHGGAQAGARECRRQPPGRHALRNVLHLRGQERAGPGRARPTGRAARGRGERRAGRGCGRGRCAEPAGLPADHAGAQDPRHAARAGDAARRTRRVGRRGSTPAAPGSRREPAGSASRR